jgi:hypothetical protein
MTLVGGRNFEDIDFSDSQACVRSEAWAGSPAVCLVGALLSYQAKSPGIESFPLEEVAGTGSQLRRRRYP